MPYNIKVHSKCQSSFSINFYLNFSTFSLMTASSTSAVHFAASFSSSDTSCFSSGSPLPSLPPTPLASFPPTPLASFPPTPLASFPLTPLASLQWPFSRPPLSHFLFYNFRKNQSVLYKPCRRTLI